MGPSHEIWHHGSRTSIILVCTPKSEQKDFVKASFCIVRVLRVMLGKLFLQVCIKLSQY